MWLRAYRGQSVILHRIAISRRVRLIVLYCCGIGMHARKVSLVKVMYQHQELHLLAMNRLLWLLL